MKSISEMAFERKMRQKSARYFFVFFMAIYSYWFIAEVGTFSNFIELYYENPEYSSIFVIAPILIYSGYRGYVNHGSIHWAPGRVCLGCSNSWYHSYDGWGYMSFGKNKKKWYQHKACKTPEKCHIVGTHQVKWVPANDAHNK